ncbi:unnamed protein product [Dimorphilus gyrociliatus]|uniref:Uncharacterized protein n=1 Tax=Dimorphilus gyrociliatus TaxID=2664684 RepID=A0A7I8WB00_9ANNE|nr:unnamed protein product [Dimorphilus gyrociliatus]
MDKTKPVVFDIFRSFRDTNVILDDKAKSLRITAELLKKTEGLVSEVKWNHSPRMVLSEKAEDVLTCLKYTENVFYWIIHSLIDSLNSFVAFKETIDKEVDIPPEPEKFHGTFQEWMTIQMFNKNFTIINIPLKDIIRSMRRIIIALVDVWRMLKRMSESKEETGALRKISNIMERLSDSLQDATGSLDTMLESCKLLDRRMRRVVTDNVILTGNVEGKGCSFGKYLSHLMKKLYNSTSDTIRAINKSNDDLKKTYDPVVSMAKATRETCTDLEIYIRKFNQLSI